MNKKSSLNLLAFFFVFIFVFSINIFSPEKASATDNLGGWAWSDNIGWISMGGTGSDGSSYQVIKNGSDLQGYAWSDSIGWINFSPSGPFPSAAGNTSQPAHVEADNTLSGWARACAGTVNGDCSGGTRTDGWDGWISLKGSNYGVTLNSTIGDWCHSNSCPQTDWAWGSDVVGWIDFSAVSINAPLSVTCSAPSAVFVNDEARWTANVSGGSGNNTYQWTLDGGVVSDSGSSLSRTYSSSGSHTASVRVSGGNSVSCGTIVVNNGGGGEGTVVMRRTIIGAGSPASSCTLSGQGSQPCALGGETSFNDIPTGNYTASISTPPAGLSVTYTISCSAGAIQCQNRSGSGPSTVSNEVKLGSGETVTVTFTYTSTPTTISCSGTTPSGGGTLWRNTGYTPGYTPTSWTYSSNVNGTTYDNSNLPPVCYWSCLNGFRPRLGDVTCTPNTGGGEI